MEEKKDFEGRQDNYFDDLLGIELPISQTAEEVEIISTIEENAPYF